MITRLVIQHYRSIENIDLQLGPVNVLVGRNGAGKSNIIDAITFVRDALKNGLDQAITDRNGIANIRQWSPTRPNHISVSIYVNSRFPANIGAGYFSFTLASKGNKYAIKSEFGEWRDEDSGAINNYARKSNGSLMVNVRNKTFNLSINDQTDLFLSYHSNNFVDMRFEIMNFEKYTIFPNTLRQPEKQTKSICLDTLGGNIASILKSLHKRRKVEAIAEIVSTMQLAIPNLENITIQPAGSYIFPKFEVRSPAANKSHTLDVDQLSDGSLRLLGLLVALYQDPIPGTIALEEPELTVHPGALQLISDSIQEASERTQVLVTTHSPDLLDKFDPSQVIAVEYENEATVARPLAKAQTEAVRNNLFSLGQLMSIEGLHG